MRLSGLWVAAVLFLAGSAQAQTADWKEYTFPEDGFAIESPVLLVKGTGLYRGAVAGRIPTVTYTGELDKIRYSVSVVDISNRIPESVNLYLEMEFLTGLANGEVIGNDSVGLDPGADRKYGRELVIEAKDGSFMRVSLMYFSGKIYSAEGTVLPGGDRLSFSPARFAGSLLLDLANLDRFKERDADPANFGPPVGQ